MWLLIDRVSSQVHRWAPELPWEEKVPWPAPAAVRDTLFYVLDQDGFGTYFQQEDVISIWFWGKPGKGGKKKMYFIPKTYH